MQLVKERPVMVGGVIADPAPTTEPDVRVSPHPAPEYKGRCHRHHNNEPYHCRGLTPESVSSAEINSAVFSTSKTPAIRPITFRYLCLPLHPPHVSLSLALPRAFASWGILLCYGIWPGRLLFIKSHSRFPRSGCPLFCDLRMVLYAGVRSSGYHVPMYDMA